MSSNKKDDISRFIPSNSLLVHTRKRGLIRLYCPFRVEVIRSVNSFTVGQKLEVVKVVATDNVKLTYIINDKGYYHYYFSILV